MELSDDRLAVFENILAQIQRRNSNKRPFVVGITGIDCAGKSHFTLAFNEFLHSRDLETLLIEIDDFHNPRAYRYSGENQIENYFNRSFDIATVTERLLGPLNKGKEFSVTLPVLNWETDVYDTEKEFVFRKGTLVLFEGVFLLRKELSPFIDYKIFLEIPFDESKRRARMRDSQASLLKYETKYIPAQKYYLDLYPPERTADMIIDNSDYDSPKIVSGDG